MSQSTPSQRPPPRDAALAAVFGAVDFARLTAARVLMVGAGGIGCELLKNLVLSGFRTIHVVDLDTIDLSNLNRQFLFQRQHVKKSKAHVAKEAALRFNPAADVTSYHESIFAPEFSVSWFASFDIVLNALDNLQARRHVNLMCLAANVPNLTHCYECEPKPTPKTFPVCTIRSTPSAPIHCIVWAKNYLFNKLFGEDDEDSEIKEGADEDKEELEKLKREANELKVLRNAIGNDGFGRSVLEKIYVADVERLVSMTDMWKFRKPPTPLALGTKELGGGGVKFENDIKRNHNVWSVKENLNVFLDSAKLLGDRLLQLRLDDASAALSFDKDDEEVMDFITAATNLRAHVFGIELLSRFKAKEMAGNIIPAIATTNAIIAGLIVLEAFKILAGRWKDCQNTFLVYGGKRSQLISGEKPPDKAADECAVCRNGFLSLTADVDKLTLGAFVKDILKSDKSLGLKGEISLSEGGRLLYDDDFDDSAEMTLSALGVTHGKNLIVIHDGDDDASNFNINFFIEHKNGISPMLSGDRTFPPRPKRPTEDEQDGGPDAQKQKVALEDDSDIEIL
ncbi:E1 ubiquitin-activating protein uba2 [Irineochytrium annulatum]|nr:E1 ubiquitin-activating protein uba2 [Irineochytrium annulatum]